MIQTSPILDQSFAVESLAITRSPETASPETFPLSNQSTCRPHIDRLLLQIEPAQVREIVGTVFFDLLRLIECLNLIETHLRQVDAAEVTFGFFRLIHEDARQLVNFIRKDALDSNVVGEELADTLDGISFAINHDLQRVFEGPITQESATSVLGKLYRAHDVLTNCLQQSTITLAMVFDPDLVGPNLFDNSDLRYRQSLQLCEDLSTLLQRVENFEQTTVELEISTLTASIEDFRNRSMEFLMYADWPQFESFCERIDFSKATPELNSVLHQFRCYLETLLGQVKMRAVLANTFPIQFGEPDNTPLPKTASCNPSMYAECCELETAEAGWGAYAFAV